MSWRIVVISRRAKLELKLDYLVVRDEESTTKVHLSEIAVLIVENTAVSLTASLVSELSQRRIKVIFCDGKRNPVSELLPYYGSHDTSLRVKNQLDWNNSIKDMVWTEIVSQKIRCQRDVLKEFGKIEYRMLDDYISQIEIKDATNREGHAAKVYFNALFGMDFTRAKDCNINAALNYGYSILLSAFNREVVSNGYITQIGLFHGNRFNQFNFSSDLMEPFRFLIDEKVYNMNFDEEFEHMHKMELVNVLNDIVKIDNKQQYVINAIKVYCRSVFDALNENDVSLMRFMQSEL